MYNKPQLMSVGTADEVILGAPIAAFLADSTGEEEPKDAEERYDPEM